MHFDLRTDLRLVQGQVLLLAGEQDPVTTIDDMVDLAEGLTSAEVSFERFADCGHGVFRDDPEAGLSAIAGFLRSSPAADPTT